MANSAPQMAEADDGWRVQPRAVSEGLCGTGSVGPAWIQNGWHSPDMRFAGCWFQPNVQQNMSSYLDSGKASRRIVSFLSLVLRTKPPCVREIFRLFNEEGRMPSQIADELNRKGVPYRGTSRSRWYAQAVNRLLRSPKYAGWHIYGMYSERLQTPRVKMPQGNWIRTPRAWSPIVSQETFDKAQAIFSNRTYHKSDQQLLDELKQMLAKHGYVSEKLIHQTPGMPSLVAYAGRFGSLSEALALIGWNPPRLGHTRARRGTRALKHDLLSRILSCCPGASTVQTNGRYKFRLRLRDKSILSIYVCRYRQMAGLPRWFLQPKRTEVRGVSLIARLRPDNGDFLDYHIMRNLKGFKAKTLLPNDDWLRTGTRLQSLADLPEAVHRVRLRA